MRAVGFRSPAPRLDALTGLRFFAALAVVFFHGGQRLFRELDVKMWMEILRARGDMAVAFFFILSGFILTYNYADPSKARSIDTRSFWVARLARIYPVYLLSQILMIPNEILFAPPHLKVASGILSALLLQAWSPEAVYHWNCVGWSISDEAFFYALFPVLGTYLLRQWQSRQLLLGMVLAWCLGLAMTQAYLSFDPDHLDLALAATDPPWLRFLTFSPICRLPEFLVGALLGRIYLNDLALGKVVRGQTLAVVSLVLLLLVLLASPFIAFVMLRSVLIPVLAALIYGMAHARGALSRLLSLRPLVVLGDASYGVYILQIPVAVWFLWGLRGLGDARMGHLSAQTFPQYVVLLIVASLGSYYLLERPAQRLIRRALGARP